MVSAICSVTLFTFSKLTHTKTTLAPILGISLFFAISSAVFSGVMLPYFFNKLKIDPAVASSHLATMIQDTMSVLIYFTVATLLI